MTTLLPSPRPFLLDAGAGVPLVQQAAALCLRPASCPGGLEVLLIASRAAGEWGLPKGHVEPGEASHQAARREAFEEAGVIGAADETVLDTFLYSKPGDEARYRVAVHLLTVAGQRATFPESGQRAMRWVPLATAGGLVANRHLGGILDMAHHFSMLKAGSGRSLLDRDAAGLAGAA
jgi:8-oxo-dGTP pyrophosphatase MutT (NUDIX family)